MAARRSSGRTAFSLFSFQDIITSVTGIMILITLILAMELLTRVEASPSTQTQQGLKQSDQTIEEIQKEIEAIQNRIATASKTFENLPSFDLQELKERIEDLEADSDRLQRETAAAMDDRDQKQRKLAEQKSQSEDDSASVEEQTKKLEQQLKEMQAKLEEIEKGSRVYYKSGVEGKTVWLVEITQQAFRVAPLGVAQRPQLFQSISRLTSWTARLDTDSNAFLLVVKPGGIEGYDSYREFLASFGFDVGTDMVTADQHVLDPETGASGP